MNIAVKYFINNKHLFGVYNGLFRFIVLLKPNDILDSKEKLITYVVLGNQDIILEYIDAKERKL